MASLRLAGASPVTSRPSIDDRAAGGVLEPGDQPQQRGLAAARGADEDDELAVLDVEVDVRDDGVAPKDLLTRS